MRISIVFLIIILFSSCVSRQKQGEEVEAISFQLKNDNKQIPVSSIATSVKMIPLETNDQLLIKEIAKVHSIGNLIYVTDGIALYTFDFEGKSINKLQETGAGPEEYKRITDFQIDRSGNSWILSRNNKKLYKYDSQNRFMEAIDLDCWVSNISLLESEKMALFIGNEKDEQNNKQLKLLDLKSKKTINSFLPIDDKKSAYLHIKSANHFASTSTREGLYFFQIFNDTIYRLSSDELKPAYVMNIDDKNVPASFFDMPYSDIMAFFQNLSKYSYAYGGTFFMEGDQSFWYAFYYDKKYSMAVIPKDDPTNTLVLKGLIEDVHLHNYSFELSDSNVFIQDEDKLILVLDPSEVMEYAKGLNNQQQQEIKKRLKYEAADQNPLLLQLTIK